jgi:hypothetical protein
MLSLAVVCCVLCHTASSFITTVGCINQIAQAGQAVTLDAVPLTLTPLGGSAIVTDSLTPDLTKGLPCQC